MKKARIPITLISVLFLGFSSLAQSGAVIKGGLLSTDYLRDSKSLLGESSLGYMAGIEIRLIAEERTYIKPAIYVARVNHATQEQTESGFFRVENGYDLIKGSMGLETRIIDAGKVHWRMALSGTIDAVMDVRGTLKFADLNTMMIGAQLSTGIDVGPLAIDLALQHGINSLTSDNEDQRPITLHLTAGFFF